MDVYKITVSFDGNNPSHQLFVESCLDRNINSIYLDNRYSSKLDRSFISVIVLDRLSDEEAKTIKDLVRHRNPEILTRKYTLTNMVRVN